MTAVFVCGTIFWSARWCTEGGIAPLVLAIVCGALAVGTKLTAAGIAPALAPFLLAAVIRRRPSIRGAAATLALAAAAFLLLGGWVFIVNAAAPEAIIVDGHPALAGVPAFRPKGGWSNLLYVPLAILSVSAGFTAGTPWPKHNVINSHFGLLFAAAALFLPFALWRYRGDPLRRERLIALIASSAAFLIALPFVPPVSFASTARYLVFVVPFVLACSIAPLVRELRPRAQRLAVIALVGVFCLEAIDIAMHDSFVPPEYIRWVIEHPGSRRPSIPTLRAAVYADEVAGPADTIAFYGAADGWVYPVFGRDFRRTVQDRKSVV
jgi:hypothetical protein